jgi:NAD(P)-dependent dehydrogenase (short-subunit alcohol dehydrogenase family)
MSTAVVTGGAGGLGLDIAGRLVADGYTVAIIDIDADAVGDVTKALPDVVGVVGDLGTDEGIERAFAEVGERAGPITVLVNNAAIYPSTPFLDVAMAEYDRVVAVNQRAYFRGAQLAARDMVAAEPVDGSRGSIVNVSSITVHGGWPLLASYVSTKGAAIALTRALARELGPHGIRVNSVAPGAFPTAAESIHPDPGAYTEFVLERQSLKRRGTGAELAAVVSFLVGPDASFVTGQTIEVDGGWVMT